MSASPHSDEQSQGLLACVEAVDNTLGAHILTKCRKSNSETTSSSLTGMPRKRKSAGAKCSENQKQYEDPMPTQRHMRCLCQMRLLLSKGRIGGSARRC